MQTKIKKASATRIGKIIFFSLLLLIMTTIAGGIIYWKIHRKQMIRNELEKTISKKTAGLYVLHYDSLNLDEVAGDLSITNLKLAFDSSKYLDLLEAGNAPPILTKIEIPAIIVTGVKTPRALLSKEIVGKNVHIKNPLIQIVYTNAGKDSARNIPTSEVYKQVLGDLNMIKVDTLDISGAEIIIRSPYTGKEILQLKNTSIHLANIAIDSKSNTDKSRFLFAKQFSISSENISWFSPDKLYNYKADSISISSASKSAAIKRFVIEPQLNEEEFVKNLSTQDDRFDFALNNIGVHHINMQELFNENFIADSVFINSSSFKIYRDLAIPRDKKNRVGSYPHQILEKIPIPLHIKKLALANSFVEYKEKNPRTDLAGKVQFHGITSTITNLSNKEQITKENNVMTASVTAKFLNKATLNLTWLFYLRHPKGRFDIKGSLGNMQLQNVNPLTQPMGPAKIEEGFMKSLHFNLAGNDYGINGSVKMLYENLKITILEKDQESRKLEKKPLASLAANIIINNSNPSGKKDEPRVITVEMERNTNRSIFHLVWKSIFQGIKETAGIRK